MTVPVAVAGRARGLGRSADAIGHCVLVFAFLPTLAALPPWMWFEVQNPLNASDPVVLAFLPVRGAILLLHAFRAGVVPGVLAGLVTGVLVCAFVRATAPEATARRGTLTLLGALGGGLAALTVVAAMLGFRVVQGGTATLAIATAAFELASGLVCGLVAAPTAVRLARGR